MPFHAEKAGIFIGPSGFKNGAKKYLIPDFQGPDGTTVLHLTLGSTTAQSGRYHRLTELGDRALAVPPPDRGGTTTGSNNCWWYHHPDHLGDWVFWAMSLPALVVPPPAMFSGAD